MQTLRSYKSCLVGLIAMVACSGLQAAALNLTPTTPDVFTDADTTFTYTAICENQNGGTGACGTGKGKNKNDIQRPDLSFGSLTIQEASEFALFYDDGSTQTGFFGNYLITADFDGFGSFLSGDVFIDQTGGTQLTDLSAPPTTIVVGDLFNFGFSGTGNGGVLEFEANITSGDWFGLSVTGIAGIIAGTTISTGIPSGSWDSSLFTSSWSGSSTPDTFTVVPVPAAVWLFGTGLLVLARVAKRG